MAGSKVCGTVVESAGPDGPGGLLAACGPTWFPGADYLPCEGWVQVPDVSDPVVINGAAVVSAPEDIDAAAAAKLQSVLLDLDRRGHATVVVDMARTLACDLSVVDILVQADQRALAAGGTLRLVLPAGGEFARLAALTRLDRLLSCFTGLDEALAQDPLGIPPFGLDPPAGRATPPGSGGGAQTPLVTSVAAGDSGLVIVLAGEADISCVTELRRLISAQLATGTRNLTIDISGLGFADSSAIRVLVLAARTVRGRGGRLVLLHPRPHLARTLAILGLDQIFTINPPG